jgi:hypothetical protein
MTWQLLVTIPAKPLVKDVRCLAMCTMLRQTLCPPMQPCRQMCTLLDRYLALFAGGGELQAGRLPPTSNPKTSSEAKFKSGSFAASIQGALRRFKTSDGSD